MAGPESVMGGERTPVEVERKFLIPCVPEAIDLYPATYIAQGYLAIEAGGTEVRVRGTDTGTHTLTIKSKGDMVRGEYETPISEEQFRALWPATERRRVE